MIRDTLRRATRRVTNGLTRRARSALGRPAPVAAAPVAAAPVVAAPVAAAPVAAAPVAAPVAPEPKVVAAPEPAPAPAAPIEEDDVLSPLTLDQVEALFEEMVRPALQADGGDVDLVKVEENDVYVRLRGACTTCPSSSITLRMGIERLLQEEFPQFGELIQVDAYELGA